MSSTNDVKASSVAVVASAGSSDSDKTSSQSPQPVVKRLKYEMCKNWREKGSCKYNDKCLFAHGQSELTKRSSLNGPEPAKKAAELAKTTAAETKEAAPEKPIESASKPASELPSSKDMKAEAAKTSVLIFETPQKVESPSKTAAPVISPKDMSTKQSSEPSKAKGVNQTYTKLSALAATEVSADSK